MSKYRNRETLLDRVSADLCKEIESCGFTVREVRKYYNEEDGVMGSYSYGILLTGFTHYSFELHGTNGNELAIYENMLGGALTYFKMNRLLCLKIDNLPEDEKVIDLVKSHLFTQLTKNIDFLISEYRSKLEIFEKYAKIIDRSKVDSLISEER